MRALITGVNGFVGPYLCDHLLAQDDKVAGFSCGTTKQLPDSVLVLEVDLRDRTAVEQALQRVQPEVIYHLAAVSSIAAARANPRVTFEVNVVGTYHLFEAAQQLDRRPRILNVSTSQVYSDQLDVVTEDCPIDPDNPYAASKVMAEQIARLFAAVDCVTVRPFNHSGPGQTTEFVLASFVAQVAEIEAGTRPPVLKVGDIDVERDFLDVRDVVRAYRLLIERGRRNQAYNLASGVTCSIGSVIEMLQALTPARFEVYFDPSRRRPGQRQRISAIPTKLMEDTGWRPEIPIKTTLADMLAYWRALQSKLAVQRGSGC